MVVWFVFCLCFVCVLVFLFGALLDCAIVGVLVVFCLCGCCCCAFALLYCGCCVLLLLFDSCGCFDCSFACSLVAVLLVLLSDLFLVIVLIGFCMFLLRLLCLSYSLIYFNGGVCFLLGLFLVALFVVCLFYCGCVLRVLIVMSW